MAHSERAIPARLAQLMQDKRSIVPVTEVDHTLVDVAARLQGVVIVHHHTRGFEG